MPKKLEEELCFQKFLCAGDFQTVKRQFLFRKKGRISHGQLVEALIMEEKLKLEEETHKIWFMVGNA